MEPTTKTSSAKEIYSQHVQSRFDGLLDLVSAKNVKIGRLIEELQLCRDLIERIAPDVAPTVQASIKNRIRNADDVLRIASH